MRITLMAAAVLALAMQEHHRQHNRCKGRTYTESDYRGKLNRIQKRRAKKGYKGPLDK